MINLKGLFFLALFSHVMIQLYSNWHDCMTSDAQRLLEQMQILPCSQISVIISDEQLVDNQLQTIFNQIADGKKEIDALVHTLYKTGKKWGIPDPEFYETQFEVGGQLKRVGECLGSGRAFQNVILDAVTILKNKNHPLYFYLFSLFKVFIEHDEKLINCYGKCLDYRLDDASISNVFNDKDLFKKHKKALDLFCGELCKEFQDRDLTRQQESSGYGLSLLKVLSIFRAVPGSFATYETLKESSKNYCQTQEYKIREHDKIAWFFPDLRSNRSCALSEKSCKELVKRTLQLLKAKDSWLTCPHREVGAVDISFLPTSVRKKFPTLNEPFKNIHINSAAYSQFSGVLSMYRAEEIIKLLTHEFLHRIDFDVSCRVFCPDFVKVFAQDYAVIKKDFSGEYIDALLLSEALTEAGACFLNILFIAAEQENSLQAFKEMWACEIRFSVIQTAKILHLSGFKTIQEFCDPEATDKRVHEWTSAVEYHIFKAALLNDLNAFMHLFICNNQNRQAPTIEDVVERINVGMKDRLFVDNINSVLNILYKRHIDFESFLYTTGRMTLIEQKLD